MKSRGGGGEKERSKNGLPDNGVPDKYKFVARPNFLSSLLLFFSFLPYSRTPEGETPRAKTRTSNNAHLKVAKDRLKSTRGRAAYSFWWGYGISHAAPQDKPERSVHGAEGAREGRGKEGGSRGREEGG